MIAGAALLLGYISTTQTLAFALVKTNPERGHTFAPGDGRVTAELAEQRAMRNIANGQRPGVDKLARQALTDEALAAPALTALALDAEIAGNAALARRLFAHSNRLSRREFGARLWMIEDAVAQGDVRGALRHYDVALRTSRAAPEILFPVLSQAIADPAIASALASTLSARPSWADGFLGHLGGTGKTPALTAKFFQRLAATGISIPEVARISVVNSLVGAGSPADGWAYYRSLRRNVDPRRSRDPDFTAASPVPSVFDWMPVMTDAGVNASVSEGVFDFAAPSTVGAIVLQQVQVLPPGRYLLAGVSTGIDQPRESQPYWQLSCSDGKEVGRVEVPNSAINGGRFGGMIQVNGRCPAQTLRLIARPSSGVGGVSGQIDRVLLAPAGGS